MPRTLTALITATVMIFATTLAARQDAARDTATIKQIMLTMTIPASDAIFSVASDPPTTTQQWDEVRTHTMTLAESGTLLMASSRAKDTTTWMEMASAMITQAEAALNAIDAQDGDALSQASDRLYTTCETCHDRYMD
jgi:hypothetical protein